MLIKGANAEVRPTSDDPRCQTLLIVVLDEKMFAFYYELSFNSR